MTETKQHIEQLKYILENLRTSDQLDNHPWAASLTVQEKASQNPSLAGKSPGLQLALVISDLFRQTMPTTPPQNGKRLDTRWGRFGILAANYFSPFLFGRLQPHSLRDAWRRIDQSILLFVHGEPASQLKPEQVKPYQLIGDELDFPANSTISDWHRSGLQDLADLFINHENHLKDSMPLQTPSSPSQDAPPQSKHLKREGMPKLPQRWTIYLALTILLLGLLLLGNEARQLIQLAQVVRQDISELERLNPGTFTIETLGQVKTLLEKTNQDVEALRLRAAPWLGLTGRLGWIPVYGGDLQHLGSLLDMASGLTSSAHLTMQTAYPILQLVKQSEHEVKTAELTTRLLEARPALEQAQSALARAQAAREQIDAGALTADVRAMLLRVDPYLALLDEALSTALSVPNLLGATDEGPKTYLLLIQNEDELRPTGGFLTAVAKVSVANGELIGFELDDSYAVDDPSKPYPVAPWQLRDYMNLPVLFFRDSNWYPDFPTTVKWAEYLYVFSKGTSIDGVIAVDQHVLATLLSVTGPLYIEEIGTTVSADNIRQVMRLAKLPPADAVNDPGWQRKHFMNPIASAILKKLLAGNLSWELLFKAVMKELDQCHIQVQLDDPALTRLLAARGWNGAMQRGDGDFLMVVDSNVGYNKTNAVVQSSLTYDVDLSDPFAPVSRLVVFHQNDAVGDACILPYEQSRQDLWYAINRCYSNYLRVYVPEGTQLLDATVHPVLRSDDPWLKEDVMGGVDTLDEPLQGFQGFGTLLLVPMGQGLGTDFQFSLPASVLHIDPLTGNQVYQIKLQKQAGTLAVPVTLRIHLPAHAKFISSSLAAFVLDGQNLLFNLKLLTDVSIQIQFRP